jgi:hypothetical protein
MKMQSSIDADWLFCPVCDERTTGRGQDGGLRTSCEMHTYPEPDGARRDAEKLRLLVSRDAVLREIRSTDAGESLW